jgi:hypothetical protein
MDGGDPMSEERGERGPKGDHGQPGHPGDRGRIGDTGDTGPTGDTGLTGRTGPAGLTGRRGAEGPSVSPRQWRRFKRIIYTVMLLLIASTAFLWWQQQRESRERCETRNAQQQATGAALAQLVEAHRLDGSTHASKVWKSFLDVSAKHPPPPC